ncbi:DUF6923 family protein [Streptomyces sp. NPDC051567]|uniref:DUF6923 family protein n=1 Tax=Streptomyces sp. NPDC051567 TaxID=3365660 RepID=UPI0037AF4A0F
MRRLLARAWACSALAVLTVTAGVNAPAVASDAPPSSAPKATAKARAPFGCAGDILLSAGADASQLFDGVSGPGTIAFNPVGPATTLYNATGVNPLDRFLYAIKTQGPGWDLLRIDNAGAVTDLGTVGLPTPSPQPFYYSAAFDPAGNFYVASGYDNQLQKINVATKTFTTTTLSQPLAQVIDFAYSGGYLWGADPTGAVWRIDPVTGTVTTYPGIVSTSTQGYGGAFTYGNGDLGFYDNNGFIVRVQLTNPASPTLTQLSSQTAPAMSRLVDATSCFVLPVDLGVTKTGPATVLPGGNVSYTIQVTNNGPNASSGWTLTDAIPATLANAATTTPGCTVTGGNLSCTNGPLAVGATANITLTGTAAAGATSIVNTAVVHGNDPDPNPANDTSTFTTVVGTPGLTLTKKQNGPATVKAGATVDYTITVTNSGTLPYTAANPASFTDDLSALLDDGRYNDDATATSGEVSYGRPVLSWSGALDPGQSATITFSLTTNVRTFGDLKLDNTVVSDTPGNNCPQAGTDRRCTTHGTVKAKDKDKD